MILEVIVLCLIIAFIWANNRPRNYPPGPLKIPIIGNLFHLAKLDEDGLGKLFQTMAKTYGKVFSLDLGSYRAVIINDYKMIKEAWSNPTLCGRPPFHGLDIRTGGVRRGILFHDGEEWNEQRRFTLHHLKDFGFGRQSMESLIMDEISELVEGLESKLGQPIETDNLFNAPVLNALWTITAGDRFRHDDPKLKELVLNIQSGLSGSGGRNPLLFMPWCHDIVPNLSGWSKLRDIADILWHHLEPISLEMMRNYSGGSPQHFAHVYIDEIRRTSDVNSSFYGTRGEKTLVAVLMDLFQAGAETTSTTLGWLFLYLTVFPNVQVKLQEEIDRVIGRRTVPATEHRARMPYTEAVILETLRLSSMVPLGLFHYALDDVQFRGYSIPKGTIVIANFYSAHHDPAIWDEPDKFQPERFLTADGQSTAKNLEGFLAFSTGKRVCLGESLARTELFLFTTTILQQFHITWDPTEDKPSLAKQPGCIIRPKPYKVVLSHRAA